MIQSYWPTGERVFAVNGPSWSVSDEMFFYLLFPFIAYGLIWLGVGRSLRLAVLAGTTIFLPMIFIRLWTMPTFGLGWWLLYISPFIRIFDFVFGVIVGLAFERFCKLTRPWDRRKSTAFEIAVVFLFAGVVLKGVPAPEFANGDFWYIPVMALVILCFASSTGVLASVLNSSLLVYLGEISYSIYMTHVIVIEWASRFLSAQFFGSSDNVSIIMAQFGIIVFVLCLSDVLFRWVETPARNYARQYARERFGIY